MNLLKIKYILIVSLFLVFSFAHQAEAATLYFSPSLGSFSVGNLLSTSVLVNTQGQAVNNSDAVINFPTDLLDVVSIGKSGSIFSLWVEEPAFSNSAGTITFSGGLPTPGFNGAAGKIIDIVFRVRRAGTASVLFSSGAVRANDGYGTDILQTRTQAKFNLTLGEKPPVVPQPTTPVIPQTPQEATGLPGLLAQITSSTHPDQTRWYNLTHVILDWTNAQGVISVRLGYDQDAAGPPHVLYADPVSHKEIDLQDGIWYFHIQERGPAGWGPISTFRVQIDTVPPLPITLQFPNGATTTAATIAAVFSTTDALSGIDHYELSVDGVSHTASTEDGSGVYALPSGDAGEHTLVVTAYDKAGNTARAEGRFNSALAPAKPSLPSLAWLTVNYFSLALAVLALLFLTVVSGWYLWHRFHLFRHRALRQSSHMHIVLRQHFSNLKNAVVDEIAQLEKVRSKRALTLEEERLITRLQKLIDLSERAIEREIDDEINKTRRSSRA